MFELFFLSIERPHKIEQTHVHVQDKGFFYFLQFYFG